MGRALTNLTSVASPDKKFVGIPPEDIPRKFGDSIALLAVCVLLVLVLILAGGVPFRVLGPVLGVACAAMVGLAVVFWANFKRGIWNATLTAEAVTFGYWGHTRTLPWSSHRAVRVVRSWGRGAGQLPTYKLTFEDPSTHALVELALGTKLGGAVSLYPAARISGAGESPATRLK